MARLGALPPLLTTTALVFPQRNLPSRVRLAVEGLVSAVTGERSGEGVIGPPTANAWVIAFNTTGGRMVLQSYSSQPLVLVLMMCQPIV
jgi:hypothetical protein